MSLKHELNKQVANLSVLFTKLHHYHWYVKGPQFFQLHETFEKLYDEVNELYDEFAERLLMIGGKPVSTQKGNLELATIKEETNHQMDAAAMVKSILADYKQLVAEFKVGLGLASEASDEVTTDMYVGVLSSFEKHIWMLEAVLA